MNLTLLYNKLCCIMQWNIGFSKCDINHIIRNKQGELTFNWMPQFNNAVSVADPFIFKGKDGRLNLLYENFSMSDPSKYGKIFLAVIDKNFKPTDSKQLLDTKQHSSYPFIFIENGLTYIIPETSALNKVSAYEYNHEQHTLSNEKILINNKPLLDASVFKYNNKYWLFATSADNGFDHSKLYIYYADSLFGDYKPHAKNPVKDNADGSRPAGNIINVDGENYRPAQNCSRYYGESITINKINTLTENEFNEEFYLKIKPDKNSAFKSGIHTINVIDDVIVVDGIKMQFRPIKKWKLFFDKHLKKSLIH